ncbi:lactoylglutathione lyase [Dendroctonus ponderosae]|uniref:lactoylglutathione lyase n=1 Tax=Dendroctonus ponderosae TaxID=77166 RepID=UPI0020356EDB|nr:lactoylglutathione lyase [Dendroctonus ponderosae]
MEAAPKVVCTCKAATTGANAPLSHQEALDLCGTQASIDTTDYVMQQTMFRIKDPKVSLPFYSNVLGMKLLTKADFPSMKFSLYFMGYQRSTPGQLGSIARTEWALERKATIELTHNWGTENDADFTVHNGNQEPKGFGHIGIMVPDVDQACERFEKLCVKFVKKPNDGTMKGIAFIADPDGYWIEILNNRVTANLIVQHST